MIAAFQAIFLLLQVVGFIMFAFIAFFFLGMAIHMIIYTVHNLGRVIVGRSWLPLDPNQKGLR